MTVTEGHRLATRKLGPDAYLPMELLRACRMVERGESPDRVADLYEEIAQVYAMRPASDLCGRKHNAEMVELVTGLAVRFRRQAQAAFSAPLTPATATR